MKQHVLTLLLLLTASAIARADAETDREMARINRDRDTYLSADARAATESEARNQAIRQLGAQVSDYLRQSGSAMTLTEATNEFQLLTSQIDSNRFRVMAYVAKSDLGGSQTSPKSYDESRYASPDTKPSSRKDEPDDYYYDLKPEEQNSNSALSEILSQGTRDELTRCLEALRKSREISGAAAFPVANASDFYVAILEDNVVRRVVHCLNGRYLDVETGQEIDLNKYSRCTGYWFTIPK